VKALYAVMFVLFSFAAPAQTLETWIAAYHLDELDCFGETTQQSTGIELLCAAILDDANGVATTGSNGTEDVPVGAMQPSYDNSTEKYLTGRDDDLTVDDTIEQGAASAQAIASEPTVEKLGETKLNEADDVAITGHNGAKVVPVGAIQASDKLLDGKILDRERHALTVDDAIEQGTTSVQIATQPTIKTLGGAKVDEADDVAFVGPNDAEDVPVGAIQPGNENNNQLKADNTSAFIED
jgi:hypothetical protein